MTTVNKQHNMSTENSTYEDLRVSLKSWIASIRNRRNSGKDSVRFCEQTIEKKMKDGLKDLEENYLGS